MISFEQEELHDCFNEKFCNYFNTDEDDNAIMWDKE